MSFLLIAGREAAQEPLTMRMNSDQDERARKMVARLYAHLRPLILARYARRSAPCSS